MAEAISLNIRADSRSMGGILEAMGTSRSMNQRNPRA